MTWRKGKGAAGLRELHQQGLEGTRLSLPVSASEYQAVLSSYRMFSCKLQGAWPLRIQAGLSQL